MTNAFVVRIGVGGPETLQEALKENELILGWSEARGLTDLSLDWEAFRKIVGGAYHADQANFAKAGAAAGNLWRFIREMQDGDFVVVPSGDQFYVAKVTAPARHDEAKTAQDTAHRRPVNWLNDGRPIPRRLARAALQSRMKARQTCVRAGDLVEIRISVRDSWRRPATSSSRVDSTATSSST